MKIFLTGSESFVGREFRRVAASHGWDLTGMDMVAPGGAFQRADVLDPELAGYIPENVDAVVHLAAISRDQDCRADPVGCFRTNVLGTLNLMEAAAVRGCKQFIFASTEWVYGSFAPGEEKTEDSNIDIRTISSEYALSKLVSEGNLRQKFDRGFCPVTILRFGIIYGPRPANWSAVESVVHTVLEGRQVKVGSAQTARGFLHVKDIAEGIAAAIGLDGFHVINLQGERCVSLGEIAEASARLLGKKLDLVETDPDKPNIRLVSGALASKVLAWTPSLNIEEGLQTLVQEPTSFAPLSGGDAELADRLARDLLRVRLAQMIINEKYQAKEFKVPIHLALGHESIAVALRHALRPGDRLLLTHRNAHHNLAHVERLQEQIDEYLLHPEGLNEGRRGSMNLQNEVRGLVYTSNILGNNLPVAAGLGLSLKLSGSQSIVAVNTGDGAMEEGAFYESVSFMAGNEIPALIVVENNEWSRASNLNERKHIMHLEQLAGSLGAGFVRLQGNDVVDYHSILTAARARAVAQSRPICVEVVVTTLGHWRQVTADFPEGKFINYHAGPAPEVRLENGAKLADGDEDPVSVLGKRLSALQISTMAQEILAGIREREL